jgi:uncharacterized membrane protein YsdA (DUF1294 family)
MNYLLTYLTLINVVGFLLFVIFHKRNSGKIIDKLLTYISILGGSLGIVICIILTGNKAVKENLMSRVVIFCMLIIQIVILLWIFGLHSDSFSLNIFDFFRKYKISIVYLVIINILEFILFGVDKKKAMNGKSRIPNKTLLSVAFLGGSIGALIGMYSFRHKTLTNYYSIGIPLIILAQTVLMFYLINVFPSIN